MRNIIDSSWVAIPATALALGSLLLAAGCDTEDADPISNVAAVVTYNVGLATGYVDYAPQRLDRIVADVAALDADVVCLQEVWSQDQIDAIVAGAKETFPHSYFKIDSDDTLLPPQCTAEEANSMDTCISENCADTPASEIGNCVVGGPCQATFAAISTGCQTCAATNLGKEVDEILSLCQVESQKYSWDGHNGLLVLSATEIKKNHHTKLSSSLVQRSVLGVDISLPDFGDASFFCTHLASDLSKEIAYNGDFEDFEAENAAQTAEMLTYIDSVAGGAVLIAGDMNSGPAVGDTIEAEIPDAAFGLITAAGYTSWPLALEPHCTWCTDNTFVDADADNAMIDHVFGKSLGSGIVGGAISFIGTETFEVTPDGGDPVQTNPSDHIGFRVQFDYNP